MINNIKSARAAIIYTRGLKRSFSRCKTHYGCDPQTTAIGPQFSPFVKSRFHSQSHLGYREIYIYIWTQIPLLRARAHTHSGQVRFTFLDAHCGSFSEREKKRKKEKEEKKKRKKTADTVTRGVPQEFTALPKVERLPSKETIPFWSGSTP